MYEYHYLYPQVRQLISDFAVLLAIVLMTLADVLYGLPTPKLDVPSSIKVRPRNTIQIQVLFSWNFNVR